MCVCVCMSALACACVTMFTCVGEWPTPMSSVILRRLEVMGGRGEMRSANTQKAKRVDNKRGQEKHTHTHFHRQAGRFPPCHISFSHTQSFSPFTPPPPTSSAVVDLWSSRRSMGLRGDQARLHTSSANRRSMRCFETIQNFLLCNLPPAH